MRSSTADPALTEPILLVDLFDTIIHRSVHPFTVIERWAGALAASCAIPLPAREIARIRRTGYLGLVAQHDEPSYRMMMEDLHERLTVGGFLARGTDVDAFCRTALETEEMVEMKSHAVNRRMARLLAARYERGLITHCVSDHYLPEPTIRRFLEHLGVSAPIDRIFVSGDHAATKRSGRLYPIVLSQLGIAPGGVLMVGDNPRADGEMARRAGLRTRIIRNATRRIRNKAELLSRRSGLAWNPARRHLRQLARADRPFLPYALVYYAFTDRLFGRLKKAGARLVVFLAREGLFLKQCFDRYQEDSVAPSARVRTAYLKLSRMASTMLMLRELPDETFGMFRAVSLRFFVTSLPFDDAGIARVLALFPGLDADRVIEGFPGSPELREVVGNGEFRTLYNGAVQRNRTAFRRYLRGILGDEREIHLVDIGWRGKMQLNLHLFTSIPTAGYYLGFEFERCQIDGDRAEGLIFASYPRLTPLHGILQSNRQFYEQLAAAPHGAACAYAPGADGETVVREQWPDQERHLYEGTVREYQELFAGAFERCGRDVRLAPAVHLDNTMLARIVIRCGLSTRRAAVEFAQRCDASFAGNFREETKAITYAPAGVRISVKELLFRPDTYFKYAVKVPRLLKAKGLQAGFPLVHLYRLYLLFHLRFCRTAAGEA